MAGGSTPVRRLQTRCGDRGCGKLTDESLRDAIAYPLGATHLNAKCLLALSAGWAHEEGMAGAMRRLGVEPLPGSRHHRGCDAAAEIARLLGRVLGGLRT